jgi:hypothetical protein
MALAAPIAVATGLVRIDRDQGALRETEFGDVVAEIAPEFMARDERLEYLSAADAAVLVIVEIAPTEADGGHVQQCLARGALAEIEAGNPGVVRAVQE